MNKRKITILAVIALVLLLAASCIRIIRPAGDTLLLFHNPFHQGSASVGSDIRADFDAAGKPSENVVSIDYVGSRGGDYYLCRYDAGNGITEEYYAFDDGDLNSTVRAVVLWP